VHAEARLWQRMRPALLAAGLDPVRVENPIHPGTPDVNLADGRWIELKSVQAPVREDSILRVKHFTPQQRVWLFRRCRAVPGGALLLLEVRGDDGRGALWLLFDGDVASKVVGMATLAEHRARARAATEDPRAAPMLLVARPVAPPVVAAEGVGHVGISSRAGGA